MAQFFVKCIGSYFVWSLIAMISGNVHAQECPLEKQMGELGLVVLKKEIPGILVDLRYSGSNNFIGKDLYGCMTVAYAQPLLVNKLKKAAEILHKTHPEFNFLVYDAARPLQCQWALWNALKLPDSQKPTYVADPRRGSIHNFGCAIDISIADAKGQELDMGTGFDYFGELAHPRHEQRLLKAGKLSKIQVDNRRLLRNCMTQAGFTATTSEWWHFNACSLKQAKKQWKIIP